MKRFLVSLLFLAGLAISPVAAGELGPVVPKATGDPHPEGNAYWRINHMQLLQHDRDATMRFGDRDIQASLKACVDCHAVDGDDGAPVSIASEKHFCRTCHEYVAVKIDCFQCHNSQPETPRQALLKPDVPESSEIAAYLKEAAE
jgi:hypothetical protein